MSKKILFSLLLTGFGLSGSLQAQSVFNDTILFQINRIKTANNSFRYLMTFQTVEPTTAQIKTGTMVLSLCYCYCDSLWDAWPNEVVGGPMMGGTATVDYIGNSSGGANIGAGIGTGLPQRQRGRINIWQMPGSFVRTDPFTLPVMLRFDP
ncbi:MAG: hypothetical protein AAF927_25690 [Bacteroidota bacterium]